MNKLILLCSFISVVHASEWGGVSKLKGNGFLTLSGQTEELTSKSRIENGSEVFVEEKTYLTIASVDGTFYHFSPESSFKVTKTSLTLRTGSVWVQNRDMNSEILLSTANSEIRFAAGEGIVSYDTNSGKTQLMVIRGQFNLTSTLEKGISVAVAEKNFSFVDAKYNGGIPRDPTPVGNKAFSEMLSMYPGIKPMDQSTSTHASEGHRSIASVDEKHESSNHGEEEIMGHYLKGLNAKATSKVVEHEVSKAHVIGPTAKYNSPKAEIKIYGQSAPSVDWQKFAMVKNGIKVEAAESINWQKVAQAKGGEVREVNSESKAAIVDNQWQQLALDLQKTPQTKGRAPASMSAPEVAPETAPSEGATVIKKDETQELIDQIKEL